MATALKRVLDSVDDLPDAVKALYTSKDGKFHLELDGDDDDKGKRGNGSDDDHGGGISEAEVNRRIREAVRKAGREAAEAKNALKAYEGLGVDPEALQALIAEHAEWKDNQLANKGQWETLRQQLVDKQTRELAKKDDAIAEERANREKAETRLREHMLQTSIVSAVSENGGRIKQLAPVLRQFAKVKVDDSGQEFIEVTGEDGQPKLNKEGKPMSISEFVQEMRNSDDYASAFVGTGAHGSGTPPGGSSGGTRPPHGVRSKAEFGNDAVKIGNFVDKFGHDAYKALPDK